MRLVVIGVNHKTAPVALRERLALVGDDVNVALKQLEAFTDGSVIVSTCNRTEIYALVPHTLTVQNPGVSSSESQVAETAAPTISNSTFSSSAHLSSAAISAHIIKIKTLMAPLIHCFGITLCMMKILWFHGSHGTYKNYNLALTKIQE